MNFVQSMKEVIATEDSSARRPEMIGDIRMSVSRGSTQYPSVAVNAATFHTQVGGVSGTYVFSSSLSSGSIIWSLNGSVVSLATYGITLTGTPRASDKITVSFTAGQTSASSTATASYSGHMFVFVTFNRFGTEIAELSSIGTFRYEIELGDGGEIVSVTGPTDTSGTSVTVNVKSYLLTAMMASDWFVTTVSNSEHARTGGTNW